MRATSPPLRRHRSHSPTGSHMSPLPATKGIRDEPSPRRHSEALTTLKYSKRLQQQASSATVPPSYAASSGGMFLGEARRVGRTHANLYDDAFARQRRMRELKEAFERTQAEEEQRSLAKHNQDMREWQRTYRMKDTRTQMEREEEFLRRRKEKVKPLEDTLREKEEEELAQCTFKPNVEKKKQISAAPALPRQRSPRGIRTGDDDMPPALRVRQLADRQREAAASLQALMVEEANLRQHLRNVHSDLHDSIQREETQRVVAMLQDGDAASSTQRDLIQRLRLMVAVGHDAETAQKQIVDELVSRSQEEVRRRVLESFAPLRLESEGDIFRRRLGCVHELEALEADVIALKGGTYVEDAKTLGFEFGLADRMRRGLPRVPSLHSMTPKTGSLFGVQDDDNGSAFGNGLVLKGSAPSSSLATPREFNHNMFLQATPRSQPMSRSVSRQSSNPLRSERGGDDGLDVQEHGLAPLRGMTASMPVTHVAGLLPASPGGVQVPSLKVPKGSATSSSLATPREVSQHESLQASLQASVQASPRLQSMSVPKGSAPSSSLATPREVSQNVSLQASLPVSLQALPRLQSMSVMQHSMSLRSIGGSASASAPQTPLMSSRSVGPGGLVPVTSTVTLSPRVAPASPHGQPVNPGVTFHMGQSISGGMMASMPVQSLRYVQAQSPGSSGPVVLMSPASAGTHHIFAGGAPSVPLRSTASLPHHMHHSSMHVTHSMPAQAFHPHAPRVRSFA